MGRAPVGVIIYHEQYRNIGQAPLLKLALTFLRIRLPWSQLTNVHSWHCGCGVVSSYRDVWLIREEGRRQEAAFLWWVNLVVDVYTWRFCHISVISSTVTTPIHIYPDSKVHGANMGPIWGQIVQNFAKSRNRKIECDRLSSWALVKSSSVEYHRTHLTKSQPRSRQWLGVVRYQAVTELMLT